MRIKTATCYKFNNKENYIDFLKIAEKEGFKWFTGQSPTDKTCINYYNVHGHWFYVDVDENYKLSFRVDYANYSYATLWIKETLKIACKDKIFLTKNEFNALCEGDFKEMKIIINEPAVVLIKNGKKYVSKAHNEEFDAEKGLLMCLAKSNGVTHLDLKRMLKNATHQSKKLEGKV